jgi:hypothetical protein
MKRITLTWLERAVGQVKGYYSTCWRKSPVVYEEGTILDELHSSTRCNDQFRLHFSMVL